MQLATSPEDAMSQSFFLLALFFLGVTSFAFNKDVGDPLEWQTIILLTSLVGLVGAYTLKTVYMLIFSLMGLVLWWVAQAYLWTEGKHIAGESVLVGTMLIALLLYTIGRLHERAPKFKRFSLVYVVLGVVFVTSTLFFFSTKAGLSALGELTRGASLFASWQLTSSLALLLGALATITILAIGQGLLSLGELGAIGLFLVLLGVTLVSPEQAMFLKSGDYYSYNRELSPTGILWAFCYNVAIFVELLGLLFAGYQRREIWLINLGTLGFFLLIIVKYTDWLFSFLDKSLFFIGAGLLLFVVGWGMERGRRQMIATVAAQPPSAT